MELKYNKPIRVLDLCVIQVKKTNLYDVFQGNGWTNHRRVAIQKGQQRDTLKVVEGHELSGIQRAAILGSI